jgi:restriction system protein
MRAWVVRAGRNGEREREALEKGLLIVGWGELPDLGPLRTREGIRAAVARGYPGQSNQVIGNWTGQLYRVREEIQDGDLVVLPLRSRHLAIGTVAGPYRFRPEADPEMRHVRPVRWILKDLPRTAVRQDLLDSMGSLLTVFELSRNDAAARVAHLAAHGTDPAPDHPAGSADRQPLSPSRLAEAVAERPPGDPLRMTVREFLVIWDTPRRWSATIDQIRADLKGLGLVTRPPFTEGAMESEIAVLAVGGEPESAEPLTAPTEDAEDVGDPIAYRVSNLPSATRMPPLVGLGDTLPVAITKLVGHRVAQLAVVDDDHRLHGAISWESIGHARMSTSEPTLRDAMSPAPAAHHHDDLLRWIPEIHQSGFVFVQDDNLAVVGIVTTADLTLQFHTRVRPFVLLEEVEQRLRRIVDERFGLDEIRAAARGRRPDTVRSAADLTFGNYQHFLARPENWGKLGWAADHDFLIARLEEARKVRNSLMHFSPDPFTPEQLEPVEGLLYLLRSLDPRS